MTLPTSINPAFTPTKNNVRPIYVYKSPFRIVFLFFLFNLNLVLSKIRNNINKGNKVIIDSFNNCGNALKYGLNMPILGTKASTSPCISVSPFIILIDIIAKIGPAEASPTMPKLSSSEVSPPFSWETPYPRASINGVVIAPVVAPDASTEMAKNSSETFIPKISIIK